MMRPHWLPALLLTACGPGPGGPLECGADHGLVLTTSDFTVGALATVGSEGRLQDTIATVGGDGIVREDGGAVWQLNRSGGDTVRRYRPGALCEPEWEVALERGANAHDVLVVDDAVWVAQYDLGVLARLDAATGDPLPGIDLGQLGIEGGVLGADTLVEHQDTVVLALQRFDRTVVPWVPEPGLILQLDRDGALLGAREVGPSPRIAPHPLQPGLLLLVTGTYGLPDGGLSTYDPATGEVSTVVSEEALGRDIEMEGLAVSGQTAVLLVGDFDLFPGGEGEAPDTAKAGVACVDLDTGDVRSGPEEAGWFVDAADVDGTVWVGIRRGWGAAAAPGLLPVDPTSCSAVAERLHTTLEPYSLTSVSDPGDDS